MGPQPSSRGNYDYPRSGRPQFVRATLQWGRNLPVAEIVLWNGKRLGHRLPIELQWGRNLPVAEIMLTELTSLTGSLHAKASMGPQPSSRGNLAYG